MVELLQVFGNKIIFLALFFFLVNLSFVSALIINEIMFNPSQCSNSYCEWIEIYNPSFQSVNLSYWKLCNNGLLPGYIDNTTGNTYLDNGLVLESGQYAVITDGGSGTLVYDYFEINQNSIALHTDASSLCGSLSNTGKSILLLDGVGLVDNVTYEGSWGADGDGTSLQLVDNTWCSDTPTPGKENFCAPPASFTINYPSYVLNDGTVFLVKAETSNFQDGMYDIKLEVKDQDENRIARIYDTNDKEWQSTTYYIYNALTINGGSGYYLSYMKIDPEKNYTGTATIQGRLRLTGSSSYTETDLYVFNVENTIFQEETTEEQKETDSFIEILEATPSLVEFGDIVKVKINVYRGDTSKYAVYAYIEDSSGQKLSEKSTMHFRDKFTNYTLTVPIQLKSNCDSDYLDGNHTVIVEGLDKNATSSLQIEGINDNLCERSSSSLNGTSTLEIQNIYLGSDEKARFGDIVRIKIKIHKGNTTKNAVYLWIEDNDNDRVSEKPSLLLYTKHTDYTVTVPIQTELNCDEDYEDGTYYLVVEAFQTITEKEAIKLEDKSSDCPKESSSTSGSSSGLTSKSFEYKIASIPSTIRLGEDFETEVELVNNDDEDIDIELWSYVYRGSKCYSGDREENKQRFTLKKGSSKGVELINMVEEAEPGDYNFKVKIRKDQQVTLKELTEQISVISSEKIEVEGLLMTQCPPLSEEYLFTNALLSEKSRCSSVVIYESSSQKAKNLIPYLIIALSIFLNVILIWKR